MRKLVVFTLLALIGLAETAHAYIPSNLTWPLNGLPDERLITSDFGDWWQNQYCGSYKQLHTGLDLRAAVGEPVYAIYSGKVEVVVTYAASYQNFVTISHGTSNNPWTGAYHHIIPANGIYAGKQVAAGTKIGTIASNPNGPHLHIGVRNRAYSNTANRGRLPKYACGGDPAFPNYFVQPADLDWIWR